MMVCSIRSRRCRDSARRSLWATFSRHRGKSPERASAHVAVDGRRVDVGQLHLTSEVFEPVFGPGPRDRAVDDNPPDGNFGGQKRSHHPAHAVAEDEDTVGVDIALRALSILRAWR